MAINNTDLIVRLQLAGVRYGSMLVGYLNDLKYGRSCANKNQWDLFLLNIYLEILECHDLDSETNCFTDEEIESIFDKISDLANLCFKPLGFSYTPNETSTF